MIDGKALSPSKTARQIAAHGKEFIKEFQGVVEDAMREATHRRETWKNSLASPAMGGVPSESWVHFEINVDTSLPHVDMFPNWIRRKEKSCPENR